MIQPNKPIIDVRSAGQDYSPSPAPTPTPTPKSDEGNTPAPAANPTPGATTTTTTTTTSRGNIQTEVPAEYKASSYAELIPELQKHMQTFKPLSEEELKKLRKRQKIEGIISGVSDAAQALSNLWFTTQYAPNMYDAKNGMSAKAKERFDKEKAERDADAERYFNYAMQIGKMRDADRQVGLETWKTEQTLARTDRAFDADRADRADDVAFRNKDFDERVRQWQAGFDRDQKWHEEEAERWERQFQESIRQFNVQTSLEKQKIGIQAQQLAQQIKQGQMTFNLGGSENVTLSMDKLNAQTISRIFSTLPASVRANIKGDPIMGKDQLGAPKVIGYKDPSTETMLIAIGTYVDNSPNTQKAIREVAGVKQPNKGTGY